MSGLDGYAMGGDASAIERLQGVVRAGGQRVVLLQMGLGLVVFLLVEPVVFACSRLPATIYEQPLIMASALRHPPAALLALSSVMALLLGRRLAWSAFDLGRQIRWLAFANALALGWAFSTYPFNYWLGQAHDVDRLMLFALPWLVLWRPAWLGLFLLYAFVMAGQFNEPLNYSWTDKLIVYEVLLLLYVFTLMKIVHRGQGFLPFVGAALCLVSLYYALPATGKVWLSWMTRNEQGHIALAALHQNGWLSWLSAEGHARVQTVLGAVGPAVKVTVLVFELGVLVMLSHRRIAIGMLLGLVSMHAGIFVLTGICFWKWIVVDLSLVVILWRLPADHVRLLFGGTAVLAQLAIVGVLYMAHPRPLVLAWYDAPMCFQFRFELVGESGAVYHVPKADLAPFDLPAAQGRFYFLGQTPMLVDCLGSTVSWSLVEALRDARDETDLERLRAEMGAPRFDPSRAARFDELLQHYMAHRRGGPASWMSRLPRPPHHIWTSASIGEGLPTYEGQEPIVAARVRLREALVRDGHLHPVTDSIVRHTEWSD